MLAQTTATELAQLRDRVAYLEAELARLTDEANADIAAIMRSTNLTIGQARMLRAPATGQSMSRDRLAALCCHDDAADVRNVDSQIKRIRRRLPMLKIRNLYGYGYCLELSSIATARQIMKGQPQ